VVLRPSTVLGDPVEVLQLHGLDLGALIVQLLVGEQSRLDPLGQLDFLLRVQQGDLADLLEIVLDRVGGRTGGHDLLLGFVGIVGLGEREAFVLDELLLEGLFFGRLEGRLVHVVEAALLADGEDDLLTFHVDENLGLQVEPGQIRLVLDDHGVGSIRVPICLTGLGRRNGRLRRTDGHSPRARRLVLRSYLWYPVGLGGCLARSLACSLLDCYSGPAAVRLAPSGGMNVGGGCHSVTSQANLDLGQATPIGCQQAHLLSIVTRPPKSTGAPLIGQAGPFGRDVG